MTGLVSVIVPVYNVAPYLRECVRSVCAQTYLDLEIILVDDGSTDGSGLLCDELSGEDERITVLHRKNGGLASARNFGMEYVTGDFLLFVDSDDYLDASLVEHALTAMEQDGSDAVVYQYQSVSDETDLSLWDGPLNRFDDHQVMSGEEILARVIRGPFEHYSWEVLSKRSVYESGEDGPIRFPEGRVMEDKATTYRLLASCDRVTFLPERLYYYRQRGGSLTKSGRAIQFAVAQSQNAWEMWCFYKKHLHSELLLRYATGKAFEELVASYYGLLRGGAGRHPGKDSTKQRLTIVTNDQLYDAASIARGLRIRWFAIKYGLAGIVVAAERLMHR